MSKRETVSENDFVRKEVVWRDGVKWVYQLHKHSKESLKTRTNLPPRMSTGIYKCSACGRQFAATFPNRTSPPERVPCFPRCSSQKLSWILTRWLWRTSYGVGELIEVEVKKCIFE